MLYRLRPTAYHSSYKGILCHPGKEQRLFSTAVFSTCELRGCSLRSDNFTSELLCLTKLLLKRSAHPLCSSRSPEIAGVLANKFALSAVTTAALYRCRLRRQLLSKWIKPHLHFETFYGITENYFKTYIVIALVI